MCQRLRIFLWDLCQFFSQMRVELMLSQKTSQIKWSSYQLRWLVSFNSKFKIWFTKSNFCFYIDKRISFHAVVHLPPRQQCILGPWGLHRGFQTMTILFQKNFPFKMVEFHLANNVSNSFVLSLILKTDAAKWRIVMIFRNIFSPFLKYPCVYPQGECNYWFGTSTLLKSPVIISTYQFSFIKFLLFMLIIQALPLFFSAGKNLNKTK